MFAALRHVTLRDMPVAHVLGTLRYLPGRLTGRGAREAERPFLAQLLEGGSVVLDQRPEREVVIGSIAVRRRAEAAATARGSDAAGPGARGAAAITSGR